ncbi:hypothetical protein MXD62_16095 [Frankia sp. Mgl5]|uniref:restriction system modified-DNA reader domain-containing protein n=1 Tax=Frankiaceae TaxID=74712 RepID=UPI00200C171A|nr:hypothetical protein [Frankia sp. Mgl5]MCK9928676.1 hypothetical protein [Frankia sp. Mgl5]CAI7977243.1 RAMA domain-containing protein [Frankia sp. Hr75.2]
MTEKIEVDDEVFAYLQAQARPLIDNANDVLRRLLLGSGHAGKDESEARRAGNLARLVSAGLVQAGDRLTHTRKRSGETYHAVVTADGWTELPDGRSFAGPSPALREYVGTQIDGNKNWTHDASGKSLRQLLDMLE